VTPAGEDTIYICQKCSLAINKEIKGETEACPECSGKDFREEKAIEVGNIFTLGTRFSVPFDLYAKDEKGEKKTLVMGCYGMGLGRLMGTIVEVQHDEKGIIWPQSVAPFVAHLISLNKNTEAEKLYNELMGKGVEVLFDDREASAGEKFADADLIGIPYQLIVSEKNLKDGKVEIKNRKTGEKDFVKFEISEIIKKLK